MSDTTRAALLQLTPETYLADGFRDVGGGVRGEATALWASATCAQFIAAGLPPQELGFTVDAIQLLLPQHDEADPQERLRATVEEALAVVSGAIEQDNNDALLHWLDSCVSQVTDAADLAAFLAHAEAVRRRYGTLVAFSEPA